METKPLLTEGIGRPALVGRLIVLPVPFALIGLGVLVAVGVVLWATAWNMADSRARTEEQARFEAMGGSRIVDPIGNTRSNHEQSRVEDGISTTPTPPPISTDLDQTLGHQPSQPAGTPIDPRQEGFNYLRLATLDQIQAHEAVARLKAGGVDAFAVPLESGGLRGNNPSRSSSRFVVYLSKGFPGGRAFSASRHDRDRLVARAKKIGEAWANDGGPTGFQEPFWDKYVP